MKETTAAGVGVPQEQLTASVQALTLPKGLYTFSVRSADPERVAELGGLMLPALHVGLGPSVPADGIEFLSGREDGATWLYAAGDRVQIGDTRGDVIDIGLLRTTLIEVGNWVSRDMYSGRVFRSRAHRRTCCKCRILGIHPGLCGGLHATIHHER